MKVLCYGVRDVEKPFFEKLNENKIRITLTIQDLAEKEIDFHVFMSNSAEAQDVLLDMLEQAKRKLDLILRIIT